MVGRLSQSDARSRLCMVIYTHIPSSAQIEGSFLILWVVPPVAEDLETVRQDDARSLTSEHFAGVLRDVRGTSMQFQGVGKRGAGFSERKTKLTTESSPASGSSDGTTTNNTNDSMARNKMGPRSAERMTSGRPTEISMANTVGKVLWPARKHDRAGSRVARGSTDLD